MTVHLLTSAPGRPRLYAVPTPKGIVVEVTRDDVVKNLAWHEHMASVGGPLGRARHQSCVDHYRRALASIDALEGAAR